MKMNKREREEIEDLFKAYLQFIGVWDIFRGRFTFKYMSDFETMHPTYYIFCAFTWRTSSEGYDFWYEVNREWLEILKFVGITEEN